MIFYYFQYSLTFSQHKPWQIILQKPTTNKRGELAVENIVVDVSMDRPSYNDVVNKLVMANNSQNNKEV